MVSSDEDFDPLPGMFPKKHGALDRLDKHLTTMISTAVHLGSGEWILSVVGTWFGIPVTSMALMPLFLTCASVPKLGPHLYLSAFCLLFTLGTWVSALRVAKQQIEKALRYIDGH